METKRTDKDKLNEATALLDDAVKRLHASHRLLTRYIEDAEQLNEHIVYLIDQYDLLMANWIDEEGEE